MSYLYQGILPALANEAGSAVVVALFANSITSGTPTLGTPALGQIHALVADGVTTGLPFLGTPRLDPPPAGPDAGTEMISIGISIGF